jgi:glycosyltransferase involved in cell wall biosynthesis
MKLSIVIPTFNNEKHIAIFFASLKKQSYPKRLIEIIAVDGGSKDKTIPLLRKHKVRVFHNPYRLAEPGISIGIKKTRGDLIMILAMDNFYHDPDGIKTITNIFNDPTIYAAFPKHDSEKNYNLFSRYHNTFTDPFNHFIYGYAANARTFKRIYKTIETNQIYDVYDYQLSPVKPMIALAQGFTIRSSFQKRKEDFFDDCLPVIDLIDRGEKIAYVHSVSIYHDTTKSLSHFIRKQEWATQNALLKKNYGVSHRINRLTQFQKVKVLFWPFYAFSTVLPFLRSVFGLLEDRNLIWLFHPVISWFSAYASISAIIRYTIAKKNYISRQ